MTAFDPTDIAAQESARAEKAARDQATLAAQASDFNWLMGSERGRRIVWGLLAQAHVFEVSYVPGRDAMHVAALEGERNGGLRILAMAQTDMDLYAAMVKEAHERNDN